MNFMRLSFDNQKRRRITRQRSVKRIAPDFDGDVKDRLDLKRKRLGIPANTEAALLRHRRAKLADDLQAKRPREPRWLQRQKRLAAKAAAKQAQADREPALRERIYAAE